MNQTGSQDNYRKILFVLASFFIFLFAMHISGFMAGDVFAGLALLYLSVYAPLIYSEVYLLNNSQEGSYKKIPAYAFAQNLAVASMIVFLSTGLLLMVLVEEFAGEGVFVLFFLGPVVLLFMLLPYGLIRIAIRNMYHKRKWRTDNSGMAVFLLKHYRQIAFFNLIVSICLFSIAFIYIF